MEYILPFIPEKIKNYPSHMDFDGQRRAERYSQVIIILFAVVGFIWGYITQLFSQTLYVLFAGVAISSLLTLIPWGMYRQHPLKWQPARDENASQGPEQTSSAGKQPQNKPKKKLKQ